MKRRILAILGVAAALVACSKSDDVITNDSSTLLVSVDPIINTRATELSFEEGDQIGLSIIMDGDNSTYVENSSISYNGSNFIGALAWYEEQTLSSTLMAYYPYVDGGSNPTSFTIKADQTAEGAYTASDLMFASKSNVTPSESAILMTFSHSLSRIVVDIDNQYGLDVSSVEICGSQPTVSVDLSSMSVAIDQSSTTVNIKAPLWDDGLYKAIIAPQSVALTFKVTFDDGSEMSVEKSAVTLTAGSEYTAEVSLSSNGISVNISGDINDWTEGGTIPDLESDGSVSFEEYDGYFVYDGEVYNTVTLSNGTTWMADNLRYVPAGYTPSVDPAIYSGVWYPYELDYAQAVIDGALKTTLDVEYAAANNSDEAVRQYGYLYNCKAIFGVDLNDDTFDSFEGAQGICPPGWHVPTKMEYFALVGAGNSMTDDSDALFYETDDDIVGASKDYAHVQGANDQGFNLQLTGYVNVATYDYAATPIEGKYQTTVLWSGNCTNEEWYGNKALTYYMTSTPYQTLYNTTGDSSTGVKGGQFWSVMTTFSSSAYPVGRLSLSYAYSSAGMAVRCVKDSIYE